MSKEISKEKTNSLLNCPFCGGEARFFQMSITKNIRLGYIKCTECGLRLEQENCTEDFATAQWNTRKPMERIVERLEEELELTDKEKRRCVHENPLQFDEAKGYARGIANAIEIVREEGGLNE